MKWRNTKERELLAAGTGCREQTLPTKNNPNPDLSDVTTSTMSSTATTQMVTPTTSTTSTTPPTSQQVKKSSNGNNNCIKNHQHLLQQKQIQQKKINVAVDQMLLNRGSGPLVARQQQVL